MLCVSCRGAPPPSARGSSSAAEYGSMPRSDAVDNRPNSPGARAARDDAQAPRHEFAKPVVRPGCGDARA